MEVARQFGYAGDFKLGSYLRQCEGNRREAATIASAQNQGKLLVKINPDVPPGSYANVVVRATGLFNGRCR